MDELEGMVDKSLTGGLSDPELEWDSDLCEATIGEDNNFPVLSNRLDLHISYSSSDTEVALISENGEITLCGEERQRLPHPQKRQESMMQPVTLIP